MIQNIYEVIITETLQRSVYVEAPNEEAASELVEKLYYEDAEIVLDSEDYYETDISVYPTPVDPGFAPDYSV